MDENKFTFINFSYEYFLDNLPTVEEIEADFEKIKTLEDSK